MGIENEEIIAGFRGDYSFLSNMYPVDCQYRGMTFLSSEHLYQWQKVDNDWWRQRILEAPHGKVAKKLVENAKCPKKKVHDWDQFRIDCMKRALWEKFKNPELRAMLLATGDAVLVEENYWNDVFWGVCRGEGRNELGGLLMKLRMYLQKELDA